MKKLLSTIFFVSMLAFTVQSAVAADTASTSKATNSSVNRMQPPQKGQFGKQRPPMFNLEEELNLSDEQKAKAKANRINGRKEMKPVMDQIRTKREEILDIMDSDLTEEQKQERIKAKQEEIKTLHKKANELREKNMEEFEKILTKKQKEKFEELKKQHNPARCKSCERKAPLPPMPPEE